MYIYAQIKCDPLWPDALTGH